MADKASTEKSKRSGPPRFGNYALLKKLRSEGDYIQTFKGYQLGLEREIEIRILAIKGGPESPLATRFVEELKVISRLDHPSIVPVLDQGVAEGKRYFTTTLRNSKRLSEYLEDRGGSLPSEDFLRFAETLTDAVACIHGDGKLHRGISSTSVYVDVDEHKPYIGECSAMKEIREESLTSLGLPTLGEYVPTPEGILGETIDERTDIYLLCSLFYEMLAGKPPLPRDRDELIKLLRTHRPNFVPIPPLTVAAKGGRDIEGVDSLVMKGLTPAKADRYRTADELANELRSVATRHEVQLFVRKKAAETMKLKAPTKKPGARGRRQRSKSAAGRTVPGTAAGAAGTNGGAASAGGTTARASTSTKANHGGSPLLSDQTIIVVGIIATAVLCILMAVGLFGGPSRTSSTTTRPVPTQRLRSSSAKNKELLTLAAEVRATPTGAETFKTRVDTFRGWLVSNSNASKKVCRYTDLMKLRYRYLSMGDTKAFRQLDEWIGKAADTVQEGDGGTAP